MFLSLLKDVGFRPSVVVDVGAGDGAWSRDVHSIFPNARVIMIDDDDNRDRWKDVVGNKFVSRIGPPNDNLDATYYEIYDMLPSSFVYKQVTPLDAFVPYADVIHLGDNATVDILSDKLLSKVSVIISDNYEPTTPRDFEKLSGGLLVRSNASFAGVLRSMGKVAPNLV